MGEGGHIREPPPGRAKWKRYRHPSGAWRSFRKIILKLRVMFNISLKCSYTLCVTVLKEESVSVKGNSSSGVLSTTSKTKNA